MKIDLANIIEEWNNKQGWIYAFYYRGSILYGTSDENSDTDLLIITYDGVDIIPDENYVYDGSVKADKRIYQTSTEGYDYEIVKYSDFLSLIKEQSPLALEAIFDTQDSFYSKLRRFYKLDKWKLRESFGSIASNSFVKYLEGRNRNGAATISDIIKILSIDEICSLWDIMKVSKYTKDPTSIVKRLDTALKAHILQKV